MCICSHKFSSVLPIYNEFLYRVRPPCTWHCSLTYCWRDPELVKKSFPTSLQIKGFLDTKNLQLLLNEVLLLKCFSPMSCFRSYGRFAVNIIISHLPHRCMVSGWYVFLGTAKRKISQDQAMYLIGVGPLGRHICLGVLTSDTSIEILCSKGTSSSSAPHQQPERNTMLEESMLTLVGRDHPYARMWQTQDKSVWLSAKQIWFQFRTQCLCSKEIKSVKWGRSQMVKDTTTTCDMWGRAGSITRFSAKNLQPALGSW